MPLGKADGVRRMQSADPRAWKISSGAGDFLRSVLQVVEKLARAGYPYIALTAEAIGMSVRSLQRRLAKAGVAYSRLVSVGRLLIAARQLENSDVKVVDIALELGYSDHAHFTRAFRRWTGISPREFRRLHRRSVPRLPASA